MKTLALPVPPLALGVRWTGKTLLNWVLSKADREMKAALIALHEGVGGDSFRALFNERAKELNERIDPRIVDARAVVAEGLAKMKVN